MCTKELLKDMFGVDVVEILKRCDWSKAVRPNIFFRFFAFANCPSPLPFISLQFLVKGSVKLSFKDAWKVELHFAVAIVASKCNSTYVPRVYTRPGNFVPLIFRLLLPL